jgi:hypothetical protein
MFLHQSGLVALTTLFVEETLRLFLGGQRMSCVVDLARRTVEQLLLFPMEIEN